MTSEPTQAEVLTGEAVEPIEWAEARRRIADARFSWLATARPGSRRA